MEADIPHKKIYSLLVLVVQGWKQQLSQGNSGKLVFNSLVVARLHLGKQNGYQMDQNLTKIKH